MTQRISFTVTGRVQGVNFRSHMARQAARLGLTGQISNASDGTVVGQAQGEEDKIKTFVQQLHQGPSAAVVKDVQTRTIDSKEGEDSFVPR